MKASEWERRLKEARKERQTQRNKVKMDNPRIKTPKPTLVERAEQATGMSIDVVTDKPKVTPKSKAVPAHAADILHAHQWLGDFGRCQCGWKSQWANTDGKDHAEHQIEALQLEYDLVAKT